MVTKMPNEENVSDSTINPVPPPKPRVAGDGPIDQLTALIEPNSGNPAAEAQHHVENS